MTNYPITISFRSKTEAIEQLCLKVFGATPVYGTDVEDFKAETPEEMTKLEVELNEVKEQLAVERELAERLEEENSDIYLRRWAYSKYIESDYISCPECDALASHGVNDGPCERHK